MILSQIFWELYEYDLKWLEMMGWFEYKISTIILRLFLGNTAWNADFKVDHEKIPMIIEVPLEKKFE